VHLESSIPPCLKATCGAPDIQTFPQCTDFGLLATAIVSSFMHFTFLIDCLGLITHAFAHIDAPDRMGANGVQGVEGGDRRYWF